MCQNILVTRNMFTQRVYTYFNITYDNYDIIVKVTIHVLLPAVKYS